MSGNVQESFVCRDNDTSLIIGGRSVVGYDGIRPTTKLYRNNKQTLLINSKFVSMEDIRS